MIKEQYAVSNKPGEITLSGFTFMKDRTPDDFEVCLIVENMGGLSAGCWFTDSNGNGAFRQGRNGIIDAEYVLAWFPLEEGLSIETNIWWNPEYHLIAEFYECFRVFAKDGDASLVFEYTGGKEKMMFHLNAGTGEIPELNKEGYEDLPYIMIVLDKWYEAFKPELLNGLISGQYKALPRMGDF